jgi:hypothetical protein
MGYCEVTKAGQLKTPYAWATAHSAVDIVSVVCVDEAALLAHGASFVFPAVDSYPNPKEMGLGSCLTFPMEATRVLITFGQNNIIWTLSAKGLECCWVVLSRHHTTKPEFHDIYLPHPPFDTTASFILHFRRPPAHFEIGSSKIDD